MEQIEPEDIYNFTFGELTLKDFKNQIMRDIGPKQIDALIGALSSYVQVMSTHEMHQRIYGDKTDEFFEEKMKGVRKLQEDLGSLLKKVGQK